MIFASPWILRKIDRLCPLSDDYLYRNGNCQMNLHATQHFLLFPPVTFFFLFFFLFFSSIREFLLSWFQVLYLYIYICVEVYIYIRILFSSVILFNALGMSKFNDVTFWFFIFFLFFFLSRSFFLALSLSCQFSVQWPRLCTLWIINVFFIC